MSHFGFSSLTFSLDAGFQPCTQALIRLNTKNDLLKLLFAAFLACAGWLFRCTIYAYSPQGGIPACQKAILAWQCALNSK